MPLRVPLALLGDAVPDGVAVDKAACDRDSLVGGLAIGFFLTTTPFIKLLTSFLMPFGGTLRIAVLVVERGRGVEPEGEGEDSSARACLAAKALLV